MYRIIYNVTNTTIATSRDWRIASVALRAHAHVVHCDHAYNILSADPSVILHLATMGDGDYTIQRDECDLMICSTCGDLIGMITSQSDYYPDGKGSWQISCCAPCAAEWERKYPRQASDFRSVEIARTVLAALNPKR